MSQMREDCNYNDLWEIVKTYGEAIPTKYTYLMIYPESSLPYPKEKIKHALATLILLEEDITAVELLCANYLTLYCFMPDSIYQYISSVYGEFDNSDSDKDLKYKAELISRKFAEGEVSQQFIDNLSKINQMLKDRKQNTIMELIGLRKIIGLDTDEYMVSLENLQESKT